MHVGVLQFVTERALPVTELAVACEARGLESLWVPEHPVVPAAYELPPREILAAYRDAGADRVVVSMPTLGSDGTLEHLDRIAGAKP